MHTELGSYFQGPKDDEMTCEKRVFTTIFQADSAKNLSCITDCC